MKKVFSVITALFLLVMCGVFSACSGRYDKLEFNITYAYSEDATAWYDGNHGIFVNYGGENDMLQIDEESGVGSIFIKVEIKNVKAKYIDDIIVTKTGDSNGLNFSSATVGQNQVFRLDITGNVQTGLRFYETKSGKQVSIDLNVYRSLNSIEVDTEIKPAVAVGGMLNLLNISNLTYLPLGQTNQTGVSYQVMSIGYYADVNQERTYVESQNQTYAQKYISISDGGVLQLSQDFTVRAQEYVAKIRATSLFNENIYAEFDVYLVDTQEYTPVVHYTNDINMEDINDVVTLYRDSVYASTEFTVDLTDFNSIYKNDIMVNLGTISYKVAIYIDGVKYDLSQMSEGYNGLIVQAIDDLHYKVIATNNTIATNKLTFALEIEGLLFNSTGAPVYEKTIDIIKSVLPSNISINDEIPENGTAQGIIYGTTSSAYSGLELRLLTIPTDVNTNDYIYIEANSNVIVTGVSLENLGNNRYRVRSGETIYLRLSQNASASQLIYIRAQATPDRFENSDVATEWVEIAYSISKVVTANSLSVYADNSLANNIDNGDLYINAYANTNFYVRVDYSGATLDTSSITISSNNSNIKFSNNSSTINLSDNTVKTIYVSPTGNYNIYEVGILATSSVETGLIRVLAGDDTVGVGTEFTASSVYLVNNNRLTIQTNSTNANAIDVDNGHYNFAIVKNRNVDFEVLGYVSSSNTAVADAIIDISVSTNLDYSTGSFNSNAVEFNKISNYEFSVMGIIGSYTQVLNITVRYYAMVDNLITIVEQTMIIELAVYDPISNISINATPNQIVYINKYFEETSVSNISFSSYASNNASASTNVVFSTGTVETGIAEKVINHASQLRVMIDNIDESVEVVLLYGDKTITLENGDIISSNLEDGTSLGEDLLQGNIQVRLLSSNHLYNEITISLVAFRFGEESNVSTSTTIRFADYDPAKGITIWGDEIVSSGIDSQYIYMSFIDTAYGESDTATFNAQAYYDTNESNNMRFGDLDYILYRVQQNEDGSIALDENDKIILSQISNERLNVNIDKTNNTVTISANKNMGGGLFMMTLVTKDSYSDILGTYSTSYSLFISISDGSPQNRYTIQSVDDLKNIINDMDANYVLRNNITIDSSADFSPIGLNDEVILEFTGSLSGTVQNLASNGTNISTSRYQITLNLSSSVEDGENYYSALFARIGEGGDVSDLDINVSFDTSGITASADNGSLNIGAIAGINNGTISGVNVYINSTDTSNIVFGKDSINVDTNFGGVVGINNGYIDLTTSNVIYSSGLEIKSSSAYAHNIGSVVGTNNGEIIGDYAGKSDLNNISYTIIADITIVNESITSVGSNYYVGGVAGVNTGTIHNIIIGGKLSIINGATTTTYASGYIAGVAGQSVSNSNKSNIIYPNIIENVALLGLDISALNSGLNVAGVVGNSESTIITEVRFMSANVTFSKALSAYGSLRGDNIVAGIVASSTGDSLNTAIIENFITTNNDEIFYTFESRSNQVAGLVYTLVGTDINMSFVNANIYAYENQTNNIYLTSSSSNEHNTYYIGRVNNYLSLLSKYIHGSTTNGNHYSVIYDDETVYFYDGVWNELSIADYITREEVDMCATFTKSIADYMLEQKVSEENFNEFVASGLYINANGVYTKLTASEENEPTFDETQTYFVFDYETWDQDRVSLYEADSDGNLVNTTDTEFDTSKTYYTLTENYKDILDAYLLEEDENIRHFVKNTSTIVNIKNTYYTLTATNTEGWEEDVLGWLNDTTNWGIQSDLNYITFYDFNFYFPYLVSGTDPEPIMVIRPTDISANIDEDYVISIGSVYIDEEPNVGDYNVTSTTIINYYNSVDNPLDNIKHNTYNLVNTAGENEDKNGLINLEILPTDSQGGVSYEIVRGSAYAYISNGQIIFTGVSGNNPIVVRCYSTFNSALEEYVIFYTQLGLNELVLTSNSIYEINEENAEYELYTYTGANSVLVNVDATNIKDNLEFSTIFDANIYQYIQLDVVRENTSSVLAVEDTNSLNGVMINVVNNEFEGDRASEILTFKLMLNLTQYFGETVYPQIDNQDQMLELRSTSLRVIVYKSATDLEIDGSDYTIQTNSNIDFNASLYTGYVQDDDKGGQVDYTFSDNTVVLTEANKDSISLTMNVVDGQDELNKLLANANVENIVELFDYVFIYTPIRPADKITGYTYNITLSLKNEFDYRYIESNITLEIIVYSTNNPNIRDSINLSLTPTELSTVRIENYTATSVTPSTSYTHLISSNNIETSIISPGGYGGVMLIYLEPSYSNIVSATLTSSTLFVPSLNREVSIIFEQLVYNASTGKYQTIYPNNEQVDGGIVLRKVSYIDENNNYHYDGRIYIHTQMDMFSGLSSTIRATLTVETSNNNVKTVTKTLLTQYLPGASLSYDGYYLGVSDEGDSEYLIQEDTYNNEISIRIYGYQFSQNPNISFEWVLDEDNVKYEYGATKGIIIDEDEREYRIGDYLSFRLLNNYSDVVENNDGSYTMTAMLNISTDLPVAFKINVALTLATEDSLVTSEEEGGLIFYPIPYIVSADSAYLNGLSNGVLNTAVDRTVGFDFNFTTENPNYNLSSEIYEKLVADIGAENLAKLFYYTNDNGEVVKFSDNDAHPEFVVNIVDNRLTIRGTEGFSKTINFEVHYGYVFNEDEGKYELEFGLMSENSLSYTMNFSFTLNINVSTTEEHAIPIYSVNQIFDPNTGECLLGEGLDYILMNDITIDNLVPINVNIASFDGNNRVIKIRSFAISTESAEYGLFANISTYQDANGNTQSTILKNIIVDYSEFNTVNNGKLLLTQNEITDITFGGLVANNNGALIYNCDVMNLSASTKTVNIVVDNNSNVNVTFGGLVGNNSGIITNSRVGKDGYTRITADEYSESTSYVTGGALQFIVGDTTASEGGQGFVAVTGGFVGVNTGTIASSFVSNTSLVNYSTAPEGLSTRYSMTAGFVGENSGKISYSYVKGADTDNSTNPYSTNAQIKSTTNGNVAGFVYLNSGGINNSFANTVLVSNSAYVAGFVYNNAESGSISESYAACTLNGVATENDVSEQPFVGVSNNNELLSYGTLENTYYLVNENDDFIVKSEEGKDQAVGFNTDNFANSDALTGFVFINSNSRTEREQGVWSYYDADNNYKLLPELNTANDIAYSYRYLVGQEDEEYVYSNAISYALGSANNPYIIRSVEEYNDIFLAGGTQNSMSGYVRFINNIDFASDETAIQTRVNYILGDADNISVTSIEGNGMTISGIFLDVANATESSIGLFSEIENAYVKNLNLEFASTPGFSSVRVAYSGGLAGKINNSVIINVDLDGGSTTVTGNNFAGGLSGIITGNSLIYGIDSNLSVKAVNTDINNYYMYYNETDFNTMKAIGALSFNGSYDNYLGRLSYAGGIAGVIDIQERTNVKYNLSYITINGSEMYTKTDEGNIIADYAGGIAGYAGRDTNALKLKYNVGTTNLITGQFAVGGLYAVGLGDLTASQVTAVEDEQFEYDTALGGYIMDLEDSTSSATASVDAENSGNLNLLESYKYGGGLVGIGIDMNIDSCYSKASFMVGSTVGGLIGCSIISNVSYSYAVPYVNIDSTYLEYAGGLFGSAYGVRNSTVSRNEEVSEYVAYVNQVLGITNEDNDIQFTFSTLLLDNSMLNTQHETDDGKFVNINYDYISPNYGQLEGNNSGYITSNNNTSLTYVFAGIVNNYVIVDGESIVKHANDSRASEVDLSQLYNLEDIEHTATFNNVFSGWSTEYWSLNPDKYFPLLLNDNTENYYIIDDADDFYVLINNPDGNYKIVEDIDLSGWCENNKSNFVFNVDFTGILIGEKENNEIPVLSGLSVNTVDAGNAGLFRSTNNATLRNITFNWSNQYSRDGSTYSIQLNSDIGMIGAVSADDTQSLFSNLTVNVEADSLVGTSNASSISGFGGIVANAQGSNIMNCTFVGSVSSYLQSTDSIYFGGLVGRASMYVTSESEDENMTIMNSTIGRNGVNVDFDLTISSDSEGETYIGGAVGYAQETTISSTRVGHYSYTSNRRINISVNLNNCKTSNYIGGLLAYGRDTQVSSCDVLTNINVYGAEGDGDTSVPGADTTTRMNIVGGLIGQYALSGDSVNINSSNTESYITIGDSEGSSTVINNLFVSTGVGYVVSSSAIVEIKQCVFVGEINTISYTTTTDNVSTEYEYGNRLKNVYSGGAVAYASNTNNSYSELTIDEVMVTTNIFIGSTAEGTDVLYVGGLVGQGYNVDIINSATTGRIVPITDNYSDATKINIGGMIGQANSVDVTAAYSLTSIVADGVANDVIQGMGNNTFNVNALFGALALDTNTATDLYYSSDYALFPEDSGLGTNLPAYTLAFTNLWRTSSKNNFNPANNYWAELNENGTNLPFIASLELQLINYGVISNTTGSYAYYYGGSMNPILIDAATMSSGVFDFGKYEDSYTYFILSSNIDAENNNPIAFSGELNGILMAGDTTYTVGGINDSEIDGGSAYGLISVVSDHSAVSNLHVKVIAEVIAETGKTFGSSQGNNGYITGLNEGVIFNSSVEGQEITLSGPSMGVLVGRNNGLMSYSYSNIEIVSVDTECLGGVTHVNQGKILSCYFTGYINNTTIDEESGTITKTSTSAGIIGQIIKGNSYVYNCYMAGVIESVDGNSFAIGAFTSSDSGSNNFIDSLANNESNNVTYNNNGETMTVVSCVSTAKLMLASDLKGNWHVSTVKTITASGDTQYYFNLAADSYGYNYLYPFYAINKISGSDLSTNIDNTHQLDTGKGFNDINNIYTDKSDTGYQEILNEVGSYDFFKIPHLGVLSAVQGISTIINTTEGGVVEERNTYLNYMVIYDIDNDLSSSLTWTAVGVAGKEDSDFYSGTTNQFNGLFITHKYYTDPTSETLNMDNVCTISGLHTNGLFTNINSAYFAYIKFGNMNNLENSGALGVDVGTDNEQVDKIITIANVTIDGNIRSNQKNEGESYLGGLFGTITEFAGTIKIYNLDTTRKEDITGETLAGLYLSGNILGTRAGLVAGKMEGGTIIFTEPNNEVGNKLYVKFEHVCYGGGLIGEMTGGTITGIAGNDLNSAVYVFSIQANEQTDVNANIGGIVGLSSSGETKTISNVKVFVPDMLYTNSFGGLIAEVHHSITFNDCAINSSNELHIVSNMTKTNNSFGLLTAKLGAVDVSNDALLRVQGFAYMSIDNNNASNSILVEIGTNNPNESSIDQGFGILIGRQNADFELTFANANFEPDMVISNGNNVGGLIGRYDSGYAKITNINAITYSVKLSGANNVGGAIGYVTQNINNIFNFETDTGEGGDTTEGDNTETAGDNNTYWNFLTDGNGNKQAYAIVYKSIKQNINIGRDLENWGGLFGYYAASELGLNIAEDEEVGQEKEELTITNYNNVYITFNAVNTITQVSQVIRNVGGVAGKMDQLTTVGNLRNEGNIEFVDDKLNPEAETTAEIYMGLDSENEIFAIEENSKTLTILTMNVGGVVGLMTNSTNNIEVTNIFNSGTIEGYQNVGGLIGYAENVQINNNIYEEVADIEQLTTDQVYFKRADGTTSEDKDTILYTAFVATNNTQAGDYYKLRESSASEGQITGVLNVGGAFGYVNGTVDSVWSSAIVYGNANVGGLIGALNDANTTIKNCVVKPTESDNTTGENNVIVKGVYFAKRQGTETGANNQGLSVTYFMPNSVGGLIGIGIAGKVQNNLVYDTFITSSSEGAVAPGATATNSSSSVINTIENNMVNIPVVSGSENDNNNTYFNSTNIYKYIGENTPNIVTKFNDITSGFGGFIGTVSADNVALLANADETSEIYIESNAMQVEIQAELGVNVGTFYGYYYMEGASGSGSTGTSRYIVTPTLLSDTNVSGAYNIGGVVGMFEAGSDVTLNEFNTEEINGSGTIKVQEQGVGMYVGGLIGKLKGNAQTLKTGSASTNVKIEINTNSSYYIGGLIGRLEGNLLGSDSNISSSTNISVIGDAVNEFGGLVGMLKVKAVDRGTTATVYGKHNYAFTVNTIENSNYFDGQSNFNTSEADNAIYLIAQAYYINQDSFNISATSNESLYAVNATNPLNSEAKGWHKDYTAFKRIQRNIPMEVNNGASWDSIAEIYDASRITHVGTIANLGLSGKELPYENSYTNEDGTPNIEKGTKIFDNNYICFTVYEQSDGELMLYSAMGIGELFYNQEGETTDENGNYLVPEDGMDFRYNEFEKAGTKLEKGYWIDANKNDTLRGLTYFEYGSKNKWSEYTTISNKKKSYQITGWSDDEDVDATYVIYNVDDYLSEESNASGDTPYFIFTVMYANSSLRDTPKNDDVTYTWNNASILPKSGSIFEVYGFNDASLDAARFSQSVNPWSIITAIAGLIASCTPWGAIAKNAARFIKVLIWIMRAVRMAAIALTAVGMILQTISFANDQAINLYLSVTNQNFGYISSTYSREIIYEAGKVSGQLDGILYVDDNDYQHLYTSYSSVRPSDYYSHYYFYLDGNGNTLSLSMDGIDKDGNKFEVKRSENYSYIYTVTSGNREYEGYVTYYYQNSMYYKNSMALSVEYIRSQDFFSPDNYTYTVIPDGGVATPTDTIATSWYTMDDGYYYTYGSYLGNGEYSLGETKESPDATDPNNNLKYESSKYTINGKPLSNDIDPEYQSRITFEYYGTGNKAIEALKKMGCTRLGYDYIQGVYYTINGAQVDGNKKYATYALVENPSELTSDGINYIQLQYHYTDAEGNPQTTTVWYQFSGPASSGANAQEYLDLIENGLTSTPESITITAYPSRFVNPYTTDTVGDLYAGEEIYTNESFELVGEGAKVASINQEVTYYYFDGGYLVNGDSVYLKTNYTYDNILGDDESGALNITIDVYDANGKKIDGGLTIEQVIEILDKGDGDKYYVIDPNSLEEGEDNYTLAKQYYYADGELYTWQSVYVINGSYGYLEKAIVNSNSEGDYTVDYNYNKYLSNSTCGLYTRYIYVNGSGQVLNLSGNWQIYNSENASSYLLIPNNIGSNFYGSPNGRTTYLVESLKVTLGGGVMLPLTGVNNAIVTSGEINIT